MKCGQRKGTRSIRIQLKISTLARLLVTKEIHRCVSNRVFVAHIAVNRWPDVKRLWNAVDGALGAEE